MVRDLNWAQDQAKVSIEVNSNIAAALQQACVRASGDRAAATDWRGFEWSYRQGMAHRELLAERPYSAEQFRDKIGK
jgi:hypothetical protein